MIHYTTHHGRLHHFPGPIPGTEEQVTDNDPHYVAVNPYAFVGQKISHAYSIGNGRYLVYVRCGRNLFGVYAREEHLTDEIRQSIAEAMKAA